jgi:hypothetical protein
MGGKYEVRYYTPKDTRDFAEYRSEYTNSFFRFAKLMLTKKVIYFKVIVWG